MARVTAVAGAALEQLSPRLGATNAKGTNSRGFLLERLAPNGISSVLYWFRIRLRFKPISSCAFHIRLQRSLRQYVVALLSNKSTNIRDPRRDDDDDPPVAKTRLFRARNCASSSSVVPSLTNCRTMAADFCRCREGRETREPREPASSSKRKPVTALALLPRNAEHARAACVPETLSLCIFVCPSMATHGSVYVCCFFYKGPIFGRPSHRRRARVPRQYRTRL